MARYDVFISYASEDVNFATELAGALKSTGFRVWYADSELKIGDKLLDSINHGLTESTYAILLISPEYLKKRWTKYEMDALISQHIEVEKRIFPLWHGVTKKEVEAHHPGLAGIFALNSDIGMHILIKKLASELAKGLPTLAVVPPYESSIYRFLQGHGELKRGNDGPAFSLWEAIIHFRDDDYPIGIEGEVFTKQDLLFHAAQALEPNPDVARQFVGEDGIERIRKQCIDAGLNPRMFY